MQCKLKQRCPHKSDPLYNCWDNDCEGWIHQKCCGLMLTRFNVPTAERPSDDDKTDTGEPTVFCKKGCYQKWWSMKKKAAKEAAKLANAPKKRKVPWEEDGTLDVLMDWLTTEGNYAEYCGANGNKGKTKTQHQKELAIRIKEKLPESDRTEKDVENKITSLERQFRNAADWANNTGAGVDNPGDFEAAVLKRCSLYRELEPIMGDRPNAKPLATTEDSSGSEAEDEFSNSPGAATAISHSMSDNQDNTPPKKGTSSVSSVSSHSSGSSKKRLKSSQASLSAKRGKKSNSVDDLLATYLGEDEDGDDPQTSFRQLRVREVQARELEAQSRRLEAQANSSKARSEADLLKIQARANLLRERHKLKSEGVPQEEIDALLPMDPAASPMKKR